MYKIKVINAPKGDIVWQGLLPVIPRIGESFTDETIINEEEDSPDIYDIKSIIYCVSNTGLTVELYVR